MKTVPNTDEDDSSKEWERIKNFVGARNKPSKHPLIQEAERQNMREPQHFDEGGDVQPPIDVIPDNTPPTPTPTAPTGTDKTVNSALGGVTPEMLQALQEKLNTGNKWGQVGAGIAGIGDAIQSVGGIKGNNMQGAEEAIQRNRENTIKGVEMQAGAGKQKYELVKEIGNDDPASMRSLTAQQANLPLLTKMGFTPEEVKKMPASLIQGVRDGSISLEKARGELALQTAQLEATTGLRKEAQGNEKENQRVQRIAEITKELSALGVTGRNVTNRDQAKALQAELDKLQGGGGNSQPFDHSSIPSGTKYTAPDGTTRIKR